MESGMYTINGTCVKYPYKAYPSQIGMIDRVIKALKKGHNCLIESPTGSGKSLALLCAVLAWRQNEFVEVEKRIREKYSVNPNEVIRNSVFNCPQQPAQNQASAAQREKPEVINLDAVDFTFTDYEDDHRFIDISASPVKSRGSNSNDVQQPKPAPGSPSAPRSEDELEALIYDEKRKIPKIYFGTRTHKQLSQMVRELKKTDYANVKMTILGSRDQCCINEDVRRQPDRSEACRALINPYVNPPNSLLMGSCAFHSKWKKQFNKPSSLRSAIRKEQREQGDLPNGPDCGAWDIEDIVDIGRKQGFCPYFATANTLLADAEIVFCPYNYLIDPTVRHSVGLDLKGQVIIFDEAHNIEDVCRDAASFEFKKQELEDAADNLEAAASLADDYLPAKQAVELAKKCKRVAAWLSNVTKEGMKMQSHDVQSREWQGQNFLDELAKMEIRQEDAAFIKEALTAIVNYENEENSERRRGPARTDPTEYGLSALSIKTVEKLGYFLHYFFKTKEFSNYRICVKQQQSYDRDSKTYQYGQHMKISLHAWCMNPAVAFGDIGPNARSIILASGTLAPMNTFATELGVEFQLQLEATHVLPKDRMFIASIGKGPNGRNLRATYQNTSSWAFQDELGQLVIDVCRTVPYGVLCFFPSYKLLDTLLARWKMTAVLNSLEILKVIVIEPKFSEELHDVMQRFYNAVKDPRRFGPNCTGALFLAVCRGKVSEGLDFADDNARAVITIGIPYPNVSGLEVVHKRDYNDERKRRDNRALSGDQWYEIQAYRALNQALGRCLRHRQDWGALILVDERFADTKRYCGHLSRWIRENIRHYDSFDNVLRDLDTFTKRLAVKKNGENGSTSTVIEQPNFNEKTPPISNVAQRFVNQSLDSENGYRGGSVCGETSPYFGGGSRGFQKIVTQGLVNIHSRKRKADN